jgi:Ca-activated chloride channel family protein
MFASLVVLTAADGPIRPRDGQTAAAASIRVSVNMALVPVTVVDYFGRNVTGLAQTNFRVIDESQQRPIASFSREDQPVSVGLVFDCSASMRDKFLTARQGPVELFKRLNDGDESLLVTVSDDPVLRLGLTSRLEDIQNALVFTAPKGATSLVDGVYMGLMQLKKAHNPRKALIVISDGGDNNSRYTLSRLAKLAAEADTQIFTIGLHDDPQTEEERHGPELLEDLARASGGVDYSVNRGGRLCDVMAQIGIILHNEYVLGFYPPQNAPSGKYRKIKVQLLLPPGLPPLRIYARSGYYAPEN